MSIFIFVLLFFFIFPWNEISNIFEKKYRISSKFSSKNILFREIFAQYPAFLFEIIKIFVKIHRNKSLNILDIFVELILLDILVIFRSEMKQLLFFHCVKIISCYNCREHFVRKQ